MVYKESSEQRTRGLERDRMMENIESWLRRIFECTASHQDCRDGLGLLGCLTLKEIGNTIILINYFFINITDIKNRQVCDGMTW